MKPTSLIACCVAALLAAGCAATNPLAGEPVGGQSLAINQGASAGSAGNSATPLTQVITLPSHGAPAATTSISTAAAEPGTASPQIDEQAAAEAKAELAREFAQGQPANDGEQTVDEQLRLRALMNRGELKPGQALPEDN
jgi:hypothetical protein